MNADRFQQNPNYLPPKKDEPALHRAARIGDHESIRKHINDGQDVNLSFDIRLDPGARRALASPLMVAAGSGDGASLETMQLLLELGADSRLNLGRGSIARFAAAGLGWNYLPGGDDARLRMCLDLGCDPNETDYRGVTLLADAAASGDNKRVKVLLERNAKPDPPENFVPQSSPMFPESPFDENGFFGFQIPLHNAVAVDDCEMLTSLITSGADVGVIDRGGRTAIFGTRSPAMGRLLIDVGLDVEAQDCLGWTPLVSAVGDGSLEGVKALISAGADVNSTHDRGFTVFMSAASSSERSPEIMEVLLDAGADPLAVTELGWNAFHAAINVNGSDANTMKSIKSTFELLMRQGVDIDHRDNRGMTPLDRAMQRGTEDEVKVLRNLGAVA